MSGSSAVPQSNRKSGDEATLLVDLSTYQTTQIITNIRNWQNSLYSMYSMRAEMENIDREYMRESDWTPEQIRAHLANRRGDKTKMQNVTVPIIMPQVNSAKTYLDNVFLTGYPIFPIVAEPAHEDVAMQLETVVQENATTGGWAQQLSMFFRDGLKYNLHAVECNWEKKVNWSVGNDPKAVNGAAAVKTLWEGNVIRRMDLYNTFWDPRVHPSKIHEQGEFAGYTEIYSRIRFKTFCNSLYNVAPTKNIIAALASQPIQGAIGASTSSPFGYYIPSVNPFPFFNKSASMDWMNWAMNVEQGGKGIELKNAYSVTTVYARIIPSDYGIRVPQPNHPQVWKFIIVNGSVVLTAERLTNIHSYLPIFFGQPIEDGLDYQTKSFAQNVAPYQNLASAFWNGAIASKRRLVGDRVLYDPSRVSEAHINSTNPAAKIPVRPSAQGKPVNEAVYQFPYRDEQADSLIQANAAIVQMANLTNGQNPAQQGQFVKGNKTRHEYDDIMGHGNAQNQQLALSIEAQVFTPMKEVIKLNTLQYQQAATLYNTGRGKAVSVRPTDLRTTAIHFKVCDGLIPSDKVTGDDLLQTVIQQIGTSEQLASQYNVGQAFTYLIKTQGLDLTPFAKSLEQLQYEQALQAWQQTAAEFAKKGTPFNTPMPQPSKQLQQQMQQQQSGQTEGVADEALESTQQ
jgi:hypothetical protein